MEYKIEKSLKPIPKVLRQEDGYTDCQKNSPYFKLVKIPFLMCSFVLFFAILLSAAQHSTLHSSPACHSIFTSV